jgi:hypothetical protein
MVQATEPVLAASGNLADFQPVTHHHEEEPCRNCGTPYRGNFCPHCGQESATGAPTAWGFIYEFLTRNVFDGGKIWHTLWFLLRHPGGLTLEFLQGRRERYVRPVRLYFGVSILYFLLLSLQGDLLSDQIRAKPAQVKSAAAASPAQASNNYRPLELLARYMADDGRFAKVKHTIMRYAPLSDDERNPILWAGILKQAGKAMFFLVPVFALLLKLLFWRKNLPFGAHFLFTLHFHSVAFLVLFARMLSMSRPIPWQVQDLLLLPLWLYLLLALRSVYRLSWPGTLWRIGLLTPLYYAAWQIAVLALAITALMRPGLP